MATLYCTVEFCIDVDGMWQHCTVLLSSVLMWMECGNTVLYVEFCIDVDGMWQHSTVLNVEFCIDVDGMWQHGTVLYC